MAWLQHAAGLLSGSLARVTSRRKCHYGGFFHDHSSLDARISRNPSPHRRRSGEADTTADHNTYAETCESGHARQDEWSDADASIGKFSPYPEKRWATDRWRGVGSERHNNAGADPVAESDEH